MASDLLSEAQGLGRSDPATTGHRLAEVELSAEPHGRSARSYAPPAPTVSADVVVCHGFDDRIRRGVVTSVAGIDALSVRYARVGCCRTAGSAGGRFRGRVLERAPARGALLYSMAVRKPVI